MRDFHRTSDRRTRRVRSELKRNYLTFCLGLSVLIKAAASIVSGTGHPAATGWPEGAAAVAYLPSAVGWWEGPPFGGGEWHIQFRGDTEAFTQALTNFVAIHAPALDLMVHDGPQHEKFLDGARVDWELVVWNPESWNHLFNNTNVTIFGDSPNNGKPVPAPRLNVFIGDGGVDWSKVTIPPGVSVHDERKSISSVTNLPSFHRP